VIFLHGGSWRSGGRSSLAVEAAEWAKTGWVAINVSYRLGVTGGTPDDGKAILADVGTVLTKYRAKSYVDPNKIVVYGESAGGHLATWLGSFRGSQVAATVAISPVSSIAGAIIAGKDEDASANVRGLGGDAQEFFGYSVGTTDSHRYLDRARRMFVAFSTDEWVDPDLHGRLLCNALGGRCRKAEYPGKLHAGELVGAVPQLAVDARHWADTQV
jgi:acetyl esterase/lipase